MKQANRLADFLPLAAVTLDAFVLNLYTTAGLEVPLLDQDTEQTLGSCIVVEEPQPLVNTTLDYNLKRRFNGKITPTPLCGSKSTLQVIDYCSDVEIKEAGRCGRVRGLHCLLSRYFTDLLKSWGCVGPLHRLIGDDAFVHLLCNCLLFVPDVHLFNTTVFSPSEFHEYYQLTGRVLQYPLIAKGLACQMPLLHEKVDFYDRGRKVVANGSVLREIINKRAIFYSSPPVRYSHSCTTLLAYVLGAEGVPWQGQPYLRPWPRRALLVCF
jgi:hypothetical protein